MIAGELDLPNIQIKFQVRFHFQNVNDYHTPQLIKVSLRRCLKRPLISVS